MGGWNAISHLGPVLPGKWVGQKKAPNQRLSVGSEAPGSHLATKSLIPPECFFTAWPVPTENESAQEDYAFVISQGSWQEGVIVLPWSGVRKGWSGSCPLSSSPQQHQPGASLEPGSYRASAGYKGSCYYVLSNTHPHTVIPNQVQKRSSPAQAIILRI